MTTERASLLILDAGVMVLDPDPPDDCNGLAVAFATDPDADGQQHAVVTYTDQSAVDHLAPWRGRPALVAVVALIPGELGGLEHTPSDVPVVHGSNEASSALMAGVCRLADTWRMATVAAGPGRLSPVREGQLLAFARKTAPDFLVLGEELLALRTELAEVRWRASESEKAKDELAALLKGRTAERDTAQRLAGELAHAVTQWMAARHPETSADHEQQWAAVGAAAAACKAIPEAWRPTP